jgi:hypothetical protein
MAMKLWVNLRVETEGYRWDVLLKHGFGFRRAMVSPTPGEAKKSFVIPDLIRNPEA